MPTQDDVYTIPVQTTEPELRQFAAQKEEVYSIPARYRRIENLHILFWLIKDLSWAMLWKPLGLIMIFPTIIAALVITWQTRAIKSELLHNLAVVFWITANGYWMIVEFFSTNEALRFYTIIPFSIGLLIMGYYYLIVRKKELVLAAAETAKAA